ncbi:hypothetical protein DPMN_029990 [Dreissena polymorpha]|uniref:Uncharacterized protein n=1 Tax=Dreissena polymorpha TaxID=45954 RepID=A0A9D4RHM5_DREPO|nr:hypothetical protein DPMN_029990 [Dreissena polymorpha]
MRQSSAMMTRMMMRPAMATITRNHHWSWNALADATTETERTLMSYSLNQFACFLSQLREII